MQDVKLEVKSGAPTSFLIDAGYKYRYRNTNTNTNSTANTNTSTNTNTNTKIFKLNLVHPPHPLLVLPY